MSKKDGKKKTTGVRNDGRKNGKKFNQKRFNLDEKGRPKSGRGKPSGRSVKGMRVPKFGEKIPCTCQNCKPVAKVLETSETAAGITFKLEFSG